MTKLCLCSRNNREGGAVEVRFLLGVLVGRIYFVYNCGSFGYNNIASISSMRNIDHSSTDINKAFSFFNQQYFKPCVLPPIKPFTSENWSVYGSVLWYATFKTNKPVDNLATAEMIRKLSKRLHRALWRMDKVTAARPSGKPIRTGNKAAMWHARRSCKVDMRRLDELSDSLHLPHASKWRGKCKIRSGSPTAETRIWSQKVNIHSGDEPELKFCHSHRKTGDSSLKTGNQLFAQGGLFFPLMWNSHDGGFPDISNVMVP